MGIINVARVFGSGAVKMSEKVDLVVELEPWDKTKNYSRTGLELSLIHIYQRHYAEENKALRGRTGALCHGTARLSLSLIHI